MIFVATMGDTQRLSAEEQIHARPPAIRGRQDFTLAVEEEFAVLDPETLSLTGRFEDLQEAARGTELEAHLVGELISSEVEVRTGRCDTFEEAAAASRRAARPAARTRRELGVALGATGAHPWSPWQDQQIIDTPHYRRNDELLRYVVWRNNTSVFTSTSRSRAPTAHAVCNALRSYPSCSRSRQLALRRGRGTPSSTRPARRSSRGMFPRYGVPDAFESWDGYEQFLRFLYGTGSVTSTRNSGGASACTSPSRRSRSGSATGSPSSARRARWPRSVTR